MAILFVTAGTQLPFDRLLDAVDSWCDLNPGHEVYAQAFTERNSYRNFSVKKFLSPHEYKKIVNMCDVIVGHAGMGTIITAHEHALPVVIMPRQFRLGEHRNDHQTITAKKFNDTTGVYVATDNYELATYLNQCENLRPCVSGASDNRTRLASYVVDFILRK